MDNRHTRGSAQPAGARFHHCNSRFQIANPARGFDSDIRTYNLPHQPDVCDSCGKNLVTRDDDKPAVIAKRLQVYKDQTEPLLAYYRASGAFYEADGGRDPGSVNAEIAGVLGK